MEIQKVFSDIEGDERYYSVLMSEEELQLFSEKKKKAEEKFMKEYDKYHKKNDKLVKGALSGVGALYGSGAAMLGKSTKGMIGKGALGAGTGALLGYGAAKGIQAYEKNYIKRFLKKSDAETIDTARKQFKISNSAPWI